MMRLGKKLGPTTSTLPLVTSKVPVALESTGPDATLDWPGLVSKLSEKMTDARPETDRQESKTSQTAHFCNRMFVPPKNKSIIPSFLGRKQWWRRIGCKEWDKYSGTWQLERSHLAYQCMSGICGSRLPDVKLQLREPPSSISQCLRLQGHGIESGSARPAWVRTFCEPVGVARVPAFRETERRRGACATGWGTWEDGSSWLIRPDSV